MAFDVKEQREWVADRRARYLLGCSEESVERLAAAIDRVAELDEENAELKARVAELTGSLESKRKEIEGLGTALDEELARGISLESENGELKARVEHHRAVITDLEKRLAQHLPRVYDPADESTWPAGDRCVWVWLVYSQGSKWVEHHTSTMKPSWEPRPLLCADILPPPDPTTELLAELAAVTERAK